MHESLPSIDYDLQDTLNNVTESTGYVPMKNIVCGQLIVDYEPPYRSVRTVGCKEAIRWRLSSTRSIRIDSSTLKKTLISQGAKKR